MSMKRRTFAAIAATAGLLVAGGANAQPVKELRIDYQPSPIKDASIAMFETWGAKNGIKIVKVPEFYKAIYVEKMTASLTSNSDQYDVIWRNEGDGPALGSPAPSRPTMCRACSSPRSGAWTRSCSAMRRARTRSCRWARPSACSSIAPTSVQPSEVPKTLAEVVDMSKLQAAKKVKFGYVGAMSMNNSWFSWFWSMWGNNCDVLMPFYERDNKVLAPRTDGSRVSAGPA